MSRFILGVERSMLGRPWHSRLSEAQERHALAMAQAHGLPDLLARVLAGQGVDVGTAEAFLDPTLRRLMPDPNVLSGMEAAVERLVVAIGRREKVAILGDYDVDGAASAALLAEYLEAAGLTTYIHIPDRLLEGYGPNVEAVRAIAAAGATLLVTVDCGSLSHGPLDEAARLGLDTVVIDHHQVGTDLPRATAVVNPNRLDDASGLGHLCAAGVVFMVLVALGRALKARGFWGDRPAPDLLAGLDLVALATVADVVPLRGLNRAFVTKGLAVMRERGRPGLAALFDVAAIDGPPTTFHLGFLAGPRINAGGRIGDAALGARLLLARDPVEATRIAAELDKLNRDRRTIEATALEEAEAEALATASLAGDDVSVIVVAGEGWHPGVVGLVAARLRERYGRPAFAIALSGASGTGSGRSIPGVDLGKAVRAAVEAGLLRRGGGHAMAAGITVDADRLPALGAFMAGTLGADITRSREVATFRVDASVTADGVSAEMFAHVERAGPFGAGSPEPVVVLAGHRVVDMTPVGEGHMRLTLAAPNGARLRAVAFRAAGTPLAEGLAATRGQTVHFAGTLALNRFGGGPGRVELRVLDAATPSD